MYARVILQHDQPTHMVYRLKNKVRLTVTFLALVLSVKAQLIELPNIELISERNGLPFNTVSAIVQDRQGFIWIGSADGIARYDGYTFVTVPRNQAAAKLNSVTSLAVDKSGQIWTGQLGGLVSRLNPATESLTTYRLDKEGDKAVQTIFCDSKGVIWCFLAHAGLYRLEGKEFVFVAALNNLPQQGAGLPAVYNVATSFIEDTDYTFWVSSSNGLYHFNPATSTFKHISPLSSDPNLPTPTHQLLLDGKKGIWCSTYGFGIVYYDFNKYQFESHRYQKGPAGTNNIVYGLARKNANELWLCTSGNGLGQFNEKTRKFSFFHEGSLEGNGPVCSSLLIDRAGTLWIISDKGLMKWNTSENYFLFRKLKVSRTDNHDYYGVTDVFEDKATGRRIIGTSYADGLHVFDSTGREIIIPFDIHPAGEPYLIITDLMRTRDGRILVTSRDYLFELTRNNQLQRMAGPNTTLDPGKPAYFLRMSQSANGDIWIASSRNGLIRYDAKNKSWSRFHTENTKAFPDNRIVRISFDKQQRLWAAHHRSGVSRFDPVDNTWSHYKHTSGDSTSLVSNLLSDMIVTLSGDLWISTLEGLSKYNSQSNNFINYTQREGLPSQTIFDIASDDDGNIWAIGNKGLMMLPVADGSIQQFNYQQGIEGMYSSFLLRRGTEGKMYACTYRGYFTFQPAVILKRKRSATDVIITDVKSGNTSVSSGVQKRVIPLSFDDNSITIEFAALNFLGNQNVYRYKMMGLSQQWSETTNRVITYSGLPSGSYIFEVALAGELSYATAMKIEVSTPFWRQMWFRLLMLAIGLSGIFLVYKIRTQQIRKEEKLKASFKQQLAEAETKALKAQMSPHFIFNSLNSINRYIIKAEPEKASLYLTKFSKLIRLILDNSNQKLISLEQEISALKLYIELEALRFNEKFSYTLSVSPELNPMSIGVPPMIIQPFIENAIWHGLLHKETAGHLDVAVERFGSGLKCTITDDGIGRKKAAELRSKSVNKEKSYGMQITKERLSMLNGESKLSSVEVIDLEDENGNALGTKVIVKIMSAELEPEF
jgi:ligand-binding sensor domain-containing protein